MSRKLPATIHSVDRERHEVRVEIPGITDGGDAYPIAEIEYPLGDRSADTEIRVKEGDLVWVEFINGDDRYPLVTGSRQKRRNNMVGTRHFEHDNIQTIADEDQYHEAGENYGVVAKQFGVDAAKLAEITAGETIRFKVGSSVIELTESAVTINGTMIYLN